MTRFLSSIANKVKDEKRFKTGRYYLQRIRQTPMKKSCMVKMGKRQIHLLHIQFSENGNCHSKEVLCTALLVNININNPRISGQYIVINFFFQILYKFWFYFLILSNLEHLRQEENSTKQILLYLKHSKLLFIFIANS